MIIENVSKLIAWTIYVYKKVSKIRQFYIFSCYLAKMYVSLWPLASMLEAKISLWFGITKHEKQKN